MVLENLKFVVIQDSEYELTGKYIKIDCTVSENHSYIAGITTFAIEDGSNISDHRIKNPFKLDLSGIISDYEEALIPLFQDIKTSAAALSGADSTETRSRQVKDVLKYWHENDSILIIQTGLELYENMMITDLSFPRSKDTINALAFNISLTQVNFAQISLQKVPPEAFNEDVKTKAQSQVKKANKKTVPATVEKAAEVQEKSWFKSIVGSIN